ncbi:MAG: succinyl-diaminopimelate desuccinylase [Acidimicrobiia bacterium]|nr:succinyl-diaminopimelate desuccinylase [Acidimicrobiia bacterium]MYC58179.1 succinyl-diaminopimelate desuccinylase [Acidimicrobiia bacterium]MYG94334.1 succinyl-diaminopimelate desuccinylase [Acidimicrobiia bacterium]MYI30611.1 succinyl-diaminopimelate desuccinylase [Acidimicrobiia bacterium]
MLDKAAELVSLASVSYQEAAIASLIEARLRHNPALSVYRVGDNVVARTELAKPTRVLIGGHSDTVAPNGNATPIIKGDVLWGLGASDMKSALAVMLELAVVPTKASVDVTWLFYAREEVAIADSGLRELFASHPHLLDADVAILGEPTDGTVEAGCQGTMRAQITLAGVRAHTARPWMGVNAVHRLGLLLKLLDAYEPRMVDIDGCEFRESLQAVAVEGGVAGNVVPDQASITLGYRYAPDRSGHEAEAALRELLAPALGPDDTFEITEHAGAAAPGLRHRLLQRLIAENSLEIRAKLGWTDVAFFAERAIPAVNFGPGDPTLAHTAEERVHRAALESYYRCLARLLASP